MAKKHVTLWQINFMANRNFRNSAKTTTLWRRSLYGEKTCNFMGDKLYGEQEFSKFSKTSTLWADVTLWRTPMGHFMVRVLYGRQDFHESLKLIILWRGPLYGETACSFMVG